MPFTIENGVRIDAARAYRFESRLTQEVRGRTIANVTGQASRSIFYSVKMTANTFGSGLRAATTLISPPPPGPARHPVALLVTESLEPSGVGEHMATLAAMLRDDVQAVLVFADSPGGNALARRVRASGLAARVMPADALTVGGPEFTAALDQYRPEVVHVHAGIGWEGHQLAAAARAWGALAIVRTEHLPYTLRALKKPSLEAAYARGVEKVDRIICVCQAARRTFLMSGVEEARFSVIYNGIVPRPSGRGRDEVRGRLGAGHGPLILTVARFTEQKGHSTLLNALPGVLAAHPGAHLAWVGNGPLEEQLRARAGVLGVAGNILFLGCRDDVGDLMAAADVLCLPSYFEGHPLVVLEAMAAGLPVVAARSLGITEAVRNGETGLLVPFDNAPVLVDALCRVLNEPELAARLGAAGRAAVRQHFSAHRMARETLSLYMNVLDGQSKPGQGLARTPRR
jgi:glycosyltransferase involved in cell wall biosynthesis